MPLFTYTARNQQGEIVSGTLDALNLDAAEDTLRDMNLLPDQVYQSIGTPSNSAIGHDTTPEYKSPWEDDQLEKELDAEPAFSFEDAVSANTPEELLSQPIEPLETETVNNKEVDSIVNWTTIDDQKLHETKDTHTPLPASSPHLENEKPYTQSNKQYYPLSETLRLYAGWLLAWYGIVYALGHYESTRETTLEIPYVQGLLLSPLVLTFTLAAFLFLLFSTIHKSVGNTKLTSFICTVLGIGTFIYFRMNV